MTKMPIVTCIRSEGSKANLVVGDRYLVVADVRSAVTKHSDTSSGYMIRDYDDGSAGAVHPGIFDRTRFQAVADEDLDR